MGGGGCEVEEVGECVAVVSISRLGMGRNRRGEVLESCACAESV